MSDSPGPFAPQALRVRCLVMGVDGVLTDRTVYATPKGKTFERLHQGDAEGIESLLGAGIHVSVMSRRLSSALRHWLRARGVTDLQRTHSDKLAAVRQLAQRLGCSLAEVAFIGEDQLDAEIMDVVGLPIAVPDAHPTVRASARVITRARGGRGAVCEAIDSILEVCALPAVAARTEQASLAHGNEFPFSVVIPARYGSTRLPGKPLLDLAGRPMIAWVCDAARASCATSVCVATDDARIVDAVRREGVEAVLTSTEHSTGTDRLSEVARLKRLSDNEVVVNVQGDEPLIPPELIRAVARALVLRPEAGMATVATPIRAPQELFNPNVVKVVLDAAQFACYFSRAPIPWVRGAFEPGVLPEQLPGDATFLRHVGLYAYRVGTLRRLTSVPQTTHEMAESLEQLRALDMGIRIHVSTVDIPPGHGIDTVADLTRVSAQISAAKHEASYPTELQAR